MAKKVIEPQTSVTEDAPVELSAAAKRSIDKVIAPFREFAAEFGTLAVSREELAPRFMKAFEMFRKAVGEEATFVQFVRYVDPSVPADRTGYKASKVYQAADYLRRLDASLRAAKRPKADGIDAPTRPMDAVARLLASVMPIIPEDQRAKVWEALRSELHWPEVTVRKMQKAVDDVLPLVAAVTPRGVSMPAMKVRIVHMNPTKALEAEAREPVAANA